MYSKISASVCAGLEIIFCFTSSQTLSTTRTVTNKRVGTDESAMLGTFSEGRVQLRVLSGGDEQLTILLVCIVNITLSTRTRRGGSQDWTAKYDGQRNVGDGKCVSDCDVWSVTGLAPAHS